MRKNKKMRKGERERERQTDRQRKREIVVKNIDEDPKELGRFESEKVPTIRW